MYDYLIRLQVTGQRRDEPSGLCSSRNILAPDPYGICSRPLQTLPWLPRNAKCVATERSRRDARALEHVIKPGQCFFGPGGTQLAWALPGPLGAGAYEVSVHGCPYYLCQALACNRCRERIPCAYVGEFTTLSFPQFMPSRPSTTVHSTFCALSFAAWSYSFYLHIDL